MESFTSKSFEKSESIPVIVVVEEAVVVPDAP